MNKLLDKCIAYEIYPVSFFDSNGDGIGDLKGIIAKLDYLKMLNVNLVWINPFFSSPFRDGGYDITDYCDVDPMFGTLDDAKELFIEAKKRGINIMLDLVMGHTSDKHPWFIESQKDEKNEFTDAYIWNNKTDPSPDDKGKFLCGNSERPNSYLVNYYAHQPALNYGYYTVKQPWQTHYESPIAKANRDRVKSVIKFWLGLGAMGFRVDMAGDMVKGDPKKIGTIKFWKDILIDIRKEYPESIFMPEWHKEQSITEAGFDLLNIWSGTLTECYGYNQNLPLYFSKKCNNPLFTFTIPMNILKRKLKEKGAIVLMPSCHDRGRINRDGMSDNQLKCIQIFMRTMPCIYFNYMGDEIGIFSRRDIKSRDAGYSRTRARTPMQWDSSLNLGFTSNQSSYLPVEPSDEHTVDTQLKDKDSLLNICIKLNEIKSGKDCFDLSAKFKILKSSGLLGCPVIYERVGKTSRAVVVIAPKEKCYHVNIGKWINPSKAIVLVNASINAGTLMLQSESAAVFVEDLKL